MTCKLLDRGGAIIIHVDLAPEDEDEDIIDVMVFVCPADEPCLLPVGTFDR